MRTFFAWIALSGCVAAAAVTPVRAQTQCTVIGSASTWGFPAEGYFDVPSGGTCLFSLNINGEILSASVAQPPANGKVEVISVSSYTYTANPGFTGKDVIVIRATGKDVNGVGGTTMFTMNATVR